MNYTILIVDDDMVINDMLVKYLRKNGYITYSAYSGTEALLFLEKQKVNLIILDLMLPGLSGEQVLAEIKKTKNVPVIGLSAKEDSKSKISLNHYNILAKSVPVPHHLYRILQKL